MAPFARRMPCTKSTARERQPRLRPAKRNRIHGANAQGAPLAEIQRRQEGLHIHHERMARRTGTGREHAQTRVGCARRLDGKGTVGGAPRPLRWTSSLPAVAVATAMVRAPPRFGRPDQEGVGDPATPNTIATPTSSATQASAAHTNAWRIETAPLVACSLAMRRPTPTQCEYLGSERPRGTDERGASHRSATPATPTRLRLSPDDREVLIAA